MSDATAANSIQRNRQRLVFSEGRAHNVKRSVPEPHGVVPSIAGQAQDHIGELQPVSFDGLWAVVDIDSDDLPGLIKCLEQDPELIGFVCRLRDELARFH